MSKIQRTIQRTHHAAKWSKFDFVAFENHKVKSRESLTANICYFGCTYDRVVYK